MFVVEKTMRLLVEAAEVTTALEVISAMDTHLGLLVSSFLLDMYLLTAPLMCSLIRDFFVDISRPNKVDNFEHVSIQFDYKFNS